MKKMIICTVAALAMLSCAGGPPDPGKFKAVEGFEYLHLIPDSLRTPQQQELLGTIVNTVRDNLKVKGTVMYLNISEADFTKLGIPVEYYDFVLHNIKEINYFMYRLYNGDQQKIKEAYRVISPAQWFMLVE